MTRKCIKCVILLFLVTLPLLTLGIIHGSNNQNLNDLASYNKLLPYQSCYVLRAKAQGIVYKIELLRPLEADDELLLELGTALSELYKKIVEITAMYLSGYFSGPDPLSDKLLIDAMKDALRIGKIFALYLPRLIKNPNLSWQVKTKKAASAAGMIAILALWIKELYKHKKNSYGRVTQNYFGSQHDNSQGRYVHRDDERIGGASDKRGLDGK